MSGLLSTIQKYIMGDVFAFLKKGLPQNNTMCFLWVFIYVYKSMGKGLHGSTPKLPTVLFRRRGMVDAGRYRPLHYLCNGKFRVVKRLDPSHSAGGILKWHNHFGNCWQFLITTCDSAIPLIRGLLEENEHLRLHSCPPMFTVALSRETT